MKKTLLLTHEYYPYAGGVANYCYGLFSNLPEQNYIVVTDMKGQGHPSASSGQGQDSVIQQVSLLSNFIRPRWLLGLWKVSRLVKKEKIQLIFTPQIFPLGQIAYRLHRRKNLPYIISLHGLDINLALKKNAKLVVDILSNAQQVITNSQQTARSVQDIVDRSKLTVITPWYDDNMKTNSNFEALKQKYAGKKVFLTVGRLVERKGHYKVIEALHTLGGEDWVYLIVGSGPRLDYLRSLVKSLSLDQQVEFLTAVPHNELPNYYSLATIFLLPSRNIGADVEGYGIVYLEASHFGLPIIASAGTAAEEIIQHNTNGLLADGTSPTAIYEMIKYLLDNTTEATRLGQAAREHLATLPQWKDKAEILAKMLT